MANGIDALDPFMTWFREDPNLDPAVEAAMLAERQDILQRTLTDDLPGEALLECLLEQGINPDHWLDVTTENLNYVIDNGIPFASNEAGILLPVH
ncbi:hypothetical protein IQ265_12780 [Nodosilinea sp. LEGE 06152]|uniref:hypothetical protein n=1 Tax=Nodosilinea sp. LEGE 06152 TaxID=2777966 RepID=UPI001880EB20|nr:hypothetical protein [Nodosilinea sp. LEGE 06152]MBE9157694.1 hypothetical protein [Nodosilinea sp. LEGE 06152]